MVVGQMSDDTAKSVSEKIGRIMQDRENFSTNRSDTSISRSKQLEACFTIVAGTINMDNSSLSNVYGANMLCL
jgi:hypothetical protein